ncbi:MAG: hypothetical protein LBD89_01030 [Tannerellaceae bacterium]|nr:hypothetical protein [Tannerellaceae bacterium]
MKNACFIPGFFLFALVCLSNSSDTGTRPYSQGGYSPVLMKLSDLERSVFYQHGDRDLVNPGKILVKGSLIFINERYKGVHIVDNTNPQQPLKVGFVYAPGCLDMAAKDRILYLDNAVDLVAFDLADHRVAKRLRDVFPPPTAPDNFAYYLPREEDMIVVEWKKNP